MKAKISILHPATAMSLLLCCFLIGCTPSGSKKTPPAEAKETKKTFELDLIGTYMYVGPDTIPGSKCADSLARVIVNAQGTSDLFGDLTAHFDFCASQQGNYGNVHAYLVDSNADTIFLGGEGGRVVQGRTDTHPDFVTSYWRDEFEIVAGTGSYDGITGVARTDDYNSSEDPHSHHQWTGTVTLTNDNE